MLQTHRTSFKRSEEPRYYRGTGTQDFYLKIRGEAGAQWYGHTEVAPPLWTPAFSAPVDSDVQVMIKELTM